MVKNERKSRRPSHFDPLKSDDVRFSSRDGRREAVRGFHVDDALLRITHASFLDLPGATRKEYKRSQFRVLVPVALLNWRGPQLDCNDSMH